MATRNYRVGELEVKPNYTSVVRGYNFDSRYYVNDKDSPAEDIADYSGLADPGPFTQNCYPQAIGAWYVDPIVGRNFAQEIPKQGQGDFVIDPGQSYRYHYIVVAASRPFSEVHYNCHFDMDGEQGPAVNLAAVWPIFYDYLEPWGGGFYGSQSISDNFEAFRTVSDSCWGHILWKGTWENYEINQHTGTPGGNSGSHPNYYWPHLSKNAICNIARTPLGETYTWLRGINPNGFLQYAPSDWRDSLRNHYVAMWYDCTYRPIDSGLFGGYGPTPANSHSGRWNFIGVG